MSVADAAVPLDGAGSDVVSVPPMPVVTPAEWSYGPSLVIREPGKHPSLGWQYQDEGKGGQGFVLARYSLMSGYKILQRFPVTEQGWAQAWQALLNGDDAHALAIAAELAARAARLQLKADSLAYLPGVIYLGGHAASTVLTAGTAYDLRFLSDRVALLPCEGHEVLLDVA